MKELLSEALCVFTSIGVGTLFADLAYPPEHYMAISSYEFKKYIFNGLYREEFVFYVVIVFVICIIVGAIVRIWHRFNLKRFCMLSSLGCFVLVMFSWHFMKPWPNQVGVSGDPIVVEPEFGESYKSYLWRVDRLERHICFKCDSQKRTRFRGSWHCPKCEPNLFVCEKCGAEKMEAFNRERGCYLYCPKCDANGKKLDSR